MMQLRFLLRKEFRQIFRNPSILRIMLFVPSIQLLILPLAADFEIKNINISIVDHDHSNDARQLVSRIMASGFFRLSGYGESFEDAYTQFEKDKADIILEIPDGFEKNIASGSKQAGLFLAMNAINGTKASVGSGYVNRIIASYNATIRTQWMQPGPIPPVTTIEPVSLNWFNIHQEYSFFMVPGILVVLVTMICTYLCALNIVKEKEIGTIEQINVTPIRKQFFILGKLIPFWVIAMAVFSFGLFVIARLVYGIVPAGSLLVLYSFLSIYLIAILGVGLLISTYSATQQQAMSLAFFCMMIFMLMSGLFTSIDAMPAWAQWIARANPVTYFIEVIRMVMLKGSGFRDIAPQFIFITGFAIVINTWAVFNYRKTS